MGWTGRFFWSMQLFLRFFPEVWQRELSALFCVLNVNLALNTSACFYSSDASVFLTVWDIRMHTSHRTLVRPYVGTSNWEKWSPENVILYHRNQSPKLLLGIMASYNPWAQEPQLTPAMYKLKECVMALSKYNVLQTIFSILCLQFINTSDLLISA